MPVNVMHSSTLAGNFIHWSFFNSLTPLLIIGVELRASLKPLCTILEAFDTRDVLNWAPMMPRGASFYAWLL